MLPVDLFGNSLSPPFINLPEDNNSAVFSPGALTPQKRTTTEPHVSVPLAKRLQLSSESDTSDLFPEDSENSSNMNAVYGESISSLKLSTPNPLDTSNVVGTPAFITTLMMKFIKVDEKKQADEQLQHQDSLNNANNFKSLLNNNGKHSIQAIEEKTVNNCIFGLPAPEFPTLKKSADVSDSDNEDLDMNDDDECLLNNLPTSVDDLQDMEQQIKLERQINSPLTSHRQSPYDAGRLSAISGGSYAMDVMYSSASNHPEEELDADDMEVAMINESFEEQQRQYQLYCGDELKSAFYSAALNNTGVTQEVMSYQMPAPVPDSPFNDNIYQWGEESSPQMQPIDLLLSEKDADSAGEFSKPLPMLSSNKGSIESFKYYENNSKLKYDSSSNMLTDEDDDAIATVLSSANFVLENIESPHKTPADLDNEDPPLVMVAPKSNHKEDDSEDEEIINAWEHFEKPNENDNDDVICHYNYLSNNTSSFVNDLITEPPKNVKELNHVAEIYETCGELDSEPMLQHFQSIGIKNFFQRDIDVQRAFLVFATFDDAKYAVQNNNTRIKIRLLEESPQFIKMKALKMYMELLPCIFNEIKSQSSIGSWEKLNVSTKPISGI